MVFVTTLGARRSYAFQQGNEPGVRAIQVCRVLVTTETLDSDHDSNDDPDFCRHSDPE